MNRNSFRIRRSKLGVIALALIVAVPVGASAQSLIARDDVGRARAFGDIEFAIAQEAPMPRRGIHVGQDRQIGAIGVYCAFFEGAVNLIAADTVFAIHNHPDGS